LPGLPDPLARGPLPLARAARAARERGDRLALRRDPPPLAGTLPREPRPRRALRADLGLLPRLQRSRLRDGLAPRRPARPRPVIEHRWLLWLLGWGAAATLLLVLYLRQRRTGDATAADAGWGVSLAGIAVPDALRGPGGLSHGVRSAVVAGLEDLRVAGVGGRRLGGGEDGRYAELRRRWRAKGREQLTFGIF